MNEKAYLTGAVPLCGESVEVLGIFLGTGVLLAPLAGEVGM